MKKENIEKLQPFEQKLRYAVKQNFMSMASGEFSQLMDIYEDEYGTSLTQAQRNCSTCRLNALKRLGNDYFNTIAEQQKEERMKEEEQVEEKPKSKRGRPSKIKEIEKSIEETE